MFGLSSREALTSKQARWTRDIASTVNTLSNAKTQAPRYGVTMATTSSPRKSIITYINESESESDSDNCEVTTEQLLKLNNRLDDIVSRLLTIEQYQIESRLDIKTLLEQLQKTVQGVTISQPSSETSFTPYFNDEAFIGIDNRCELLGNHLKFNIEIFGEIKDKLVLYPFGSKVLTRNLPEKLRLEVMVHSVVVSLEVTTEKLANGIYVLKLPETTHESTKISYNGLI